MNVIRNFLNLSFLFGVFATSQAAMGMNIQVDLHSSVEIITDYGVISHNEDSTDSVYSYVNNSDSYSAVLAENGSSLINVDAFLNPSLSSPASHTSTKVFAKLNQKALVTNSLSDAQAVSFDFLIASGHFSNIFRSGLGAEDDVEHLSIEFCADIFLNGQAIWTSKAGLLQNKSTRINYDWDNVLTKSGVDLNSNLAAGASDGFYSWEETAGRLNLGIVNPGAAFELEYSISLIVSGSRKNCGDDSFLCEEERLYNTASQVRFGGDQILKGMKMDGSTIYAKSLNVPEPSAWMLMLVSLFGVAKKFGARKKINA